MEGFKWLTKIACVKIPSVRRVLRRFHSLYFTSRSYTVTYALSGFCLLQLSVLNFSPPTAFPFFSWKPPSLSGLLTPTEFTWFNRKFATTWKTFHSGRLHVSLGTDAPVPLPMQTSVADCKPFSDPLWMHVIKQWGLVWAVVWPRPSAAGN